jgi:hypothetical protein
MKKLYNFFQNIINRRIEICLINKVAIIYKFLLFFLLYLLSRNFHITRGYFFTIPL